MIRPAVVSLCAESAPYVLDLMRQPDVEQVGMCNVVHNVRILYGITLYIVILFSLIAHV